MAPKIEVSLQVNRSESAVPKKEQAKRFEKADRIYYFPSIFIVWGENHPFNAMRVLKFICQFSRQNVRTFLSLKISHHQTNRKLAVQCVSNNMIS